MLKADNLVSYHQYLVAIGFTWLLIFILLGRYFQIQILGFDRYAKKPILIESEKLLLLLLVG